MEEQRGDDVPCRTLGRVGHVAARAVSVTTIMAFDFGQLGETDAADPTSDFLQRERQAAGSLLGNDATLFGGSAAQETPEHDFEQAAHDFPALDDDNQFEDALSGAPERPIVPATGLPSGAALTRADSLAEFGEPDARAPVTRVDSLAEFGEADSRTGVSRPDSLAEFSETEVTREPEALGETGLEARFEASFPEPAELASGVVPVPSVAERAPVAGSDPMGMSDKKTPFTYDALDEDTEALRAWRAKQDEEIARRDAQAERMRAEAASKAEQEIDQFYADYNAEKEKNIRKNKCVLHHSHAGRPRRVSASKSSRSWPRARRGRASPSCWTCRTASRRPSPRSSRAPAT